ncbi:MAG TPA: hypothetical protein VN541_22710 [Tepidisphaeraceae bacterium]|nr:hypothetical protein [Tepidisphaeraceae bacterium]
MPKRHLSPHGLAYVRVAAFLVAFVVLLVFVCYYYLFPALDAARDAPPPARRLLAAHARLLLAVMLFILGVGLVLTFRTGRFFLPRKRTPAKPTQYPDAWAEAAKRIKVDEDTDQ